MLDPAGRVLHQAGGTEEMMPVEIDLDQVRRQRVRGMRTMGQPLKSFRDSTVHFGVYDAGCRPRTTSTRSGRWRSRARDPRLSDAEPEPVEALAAE